MAIFRVTLDVDGIPDHPADQVAVGVPEASEALIADIVSAAFTNFPDSAAAGQVSVSPSGVWATQTIPAPPPAA